MENKKLHFISSWDDGCYNDIELAEELKKRKLPATFYIPSCCMLQENEIKDLTKDFEIGGHTVTHPPDLKTVYDEVLKAELSGNKEWLQELTGKEVTKFCYPRGRYNEHVIKMVSEAGFEQARTTLVLHTESPEPYRQHTTIQIFPRKEYRGRRWNEVAAEMAISAANTGGYFHIWGHSDEIEHIGQWHQMIEFFDWLIETFEINS